MINLVCKTCGSSNFKELKESYICEYCNATIAKSPSYPKKRISLIIFLLVVIGFGVFAGYELLYSVKEDIAYLRPQITSVQQKNTVPENTAPVHTDYSDINPFKDTFLKVESEFGNRHKGNALEEAIVDYHKQEMNKAFFIALNKHGNYVFGLAYGAKSTKSAEKEALSLCQKKRKQKKIEDTCIPLAINNNISQYIIEDL